MRRNNRYISTAMIAAALVMLTAATYVRAQSFKPVRQLTSNNIVTLAGNGDTLWIATERGFNYRTSTGAGNDWFGFEVNHPAYRFWGLGFGGGKAVAIIAKGGGSNDSVGFWQFNHNDGLQQQKFFKFQPSIHRDSAELVGGVVYSNGSFWAPFNHGGLVRYDPSDKSVHAVRPKDVNEWPPQNLVELTGDDIGTKAVLSIDVNQVDNSIIVTTPKTLWRYHPIDKRWESIDTNSIPILVDTDGEFVSFDAAFTIRKKVDIDTVDSDINADVGTDKVSTLYSFITIKRKGGNDTTLYAFDSASTRWRVAIKKNRRYSVFPAVSWCVYTLFENGVSVYADKRKDTLSLLMPPDVFRDKLRRAGDDPNPKIKDILFLPRTDSSGTLAVATETGLYVCDTVTPLSNEYGDFKLYHYVRGIGTGAAYALPGIIRGGADGRYEKCVFVYKLSKDGDVTIRVYDYNMSLVKTVVNGKRRYADKDRSTVPASDVWDGTNNRGKRVWPGVYYFKITSNAGERLFGKVILAK